jgi:predicted Rossmann fold flavoprotein
VTVLEAGPRVGRKILASGNGRCNLSNTHVAPDAYNQPEFVEPVLAAFGCERVRELLGEIGLATYADDEGRVYPVSNVANSVLDVLRLECAHLGVEERTGFEVARVERAGEGFAVFSAGGERLEADAVVVATGGGSALLGELGHGSVPAVPVLGPIHTDTRLVRRLSGIRVRCAATLLDSAGEPVATERGELLFRDYGVSGVMVFDLSRFLDLGRLLSIDVFPDSTRGELEALLSARAQTLGWRTAETFFDGLLHHRVGQVVLVAAGIEPGASASELPVARLAELLKDFRLDVVGGPEAKAAQVTRGGVPVGEVDPVTLESRLVPGLFVAGEVFDVDGRCGGFNLHWAWASGLVAGQGAARAEGRL